MRWLQKTEEVGQDVAKLFDEVSRVLSDRGIYLCISLAEDHILKKMLRYFGQEDEDENGVVVGAAVPRCGWKMVLRSFEPRSGSKMQPFIMALEKKSSSEDDASELKLSLPKFKTCIPLSMKSWDLVVEKLEETRTQYVKRQAEIAAKNVIRLHVLQLKPWDDETDPADMEEEVRGISIEGVMWGRSKVVVGEYNVQLVNMECKISDLQLDPSDIIDRIEAEMEVIQAVDSIPYSAADWK